MVGRTVNNSVQSFNRSIAPDARALVARADGGRWRFFVSSTRLTLIEIVQTGTLGNMPSKQQYIAPGSAIEFQGQGSVKVYANNLDDANSTDVVTWDAGYLCGGLDRVEYAEDGLTTPDGSAWGNMGSFGGYPAPYCTRARLYVYNEQTRLKATAPNGLEVFLSGVQPVDERLYIDLDTPQGYKFEIRESNASATGVNYGVIWYRE